MYAPETEIVDSLLAEHHNGSVSGVGNQSTFTSSNIIRGGVIRNPKVGPFANLFGSGNYFDISLDNGTNWISLGVGEAFHFGVTPVNNTVKIRDGVSGVMNYSAVLAVEGAN